MNKSYNHLYRLCIFNNLSLPNEIDVDVDLFATQLTKTFIVRKVL